jgi:hypothetical protein
MRSTGQWIGAYYGHDYITLASDDWPEEFVKKNPDGKPYRYFHSANQKYYKDNVRPVVSGAIFQHYDRVLRACDLQRGDPLMLDTFSAFARSGYHPRFPSTPELETQYKRRIAEFLHNDRGLALSGEGLVEGLQDVIDYGAKAIDPVAMVKERSWEKRDGVLRVPMMPVVFQGASYYGAGWYELRNPNPNWAVGLVYGVGYWDWLPQGPQHAWSRFSRYYFSQNLIWSQNADARVRDIDQDGSRFTVTYENGNELWADVATNRWTLKERGVSFDGFTPFNERGYMAVLTQGDFQITLPGRHQLEISPHQPFRDQIRFECLPSSEKTILRGSFDERKWSLPVLKTTADGTEIRELRSVDPVLVLRKRARQQSAVVGGRVRGTK